MNTLLQTYKLILESKTSEDLALNILKKSEISEEEINQIIEKLKEIDTSDNQKNLPLMATVIAWGEENIDKIKNYFDKYNELQKKNLIESMQIVKGFIKMGDNTFDSFIPLTEYIDGKATLKADDSLKKKYKKISSEEEYEPLDEPLFSSNGIDVYEAHDVEKCIKYSQGRLTGKAYSFCIGRPNSSNMYQSYRDTKNSTFYFIVDRNRFITNEDGSVNLDDPLHIVVYDVTNYGVELTDERNITGSIAEFGKDVTGYQNYLKSKGIPVEQLKNKPKTPEEAAEEKLLGKQNTSLEWFMKLPYDYKSKYIGRGHLLSDEQLSYILGK